MLQQWTSLQVTTTCVSLTSPKTRYAKNASQLETCLYTCAYSYNSTPACCKGGTFQVFEGLVSTYSTCDWGRTHRLPRSFANSGVGPFSNEARPTAFGWNMSSGHCTSFYTLISTQSWLVEPYQSISISKLQIQYCIIQCLGPLVLGWILTSCIGSPQTEDWTSGQSLRLYQHHESLLLAA